MKKYFDQISRLFRAHHRLTGRPMHWILDGTTPVPCDDLLRWGIWFERANRHVGDDYLAEGEIRVSTVFLGMDHGWGKGPPILFETMVFGEEHLCNFYGKEYWFRDDLETTRYATWDEAAAGHQKAVKTYTEAVETARRLTGKIIEKSARKEAEEC